VLDPSGSTITMSPGLSTSFGAIDRRAEPLIGGGAPRPAQLVERNAPGCRSSARYARRLSTLVTAASRQFGIAAGSAMP
jgi:hypothetical protein